MKKKKNIAVCSVFTLKTQKEKTKIIRKILISKIDFLLYFKFKCVLLFLNKSATLI